ncbi:MAG TPA: 50S ribosomal protein L17 [Candidatus Omnitrophota bacterium]|nr:50S ribosomal protein L17 [Candidatus Omnitrophota bacterium]HOX09296.1 50S ribosomal protein L17 [Candidatus Omnitrophota bacterium]HRZ66641.1 50S ribosomal protein L17 [Candidatus Omnitrophota bacterium]
MRHKNIKRRFDRNKPERDSMFTNLARGLFISQSITTTAQKAKEARKLAERLITMGKVDTVHSRRKVFSVLRDEDLVKKLFKEISPLFANRKGGYTRIIRLGNRRGDNAEMVILELTEKKVVAPKVKPKKEKAAEAKQAPAAHEKPAPKETATATAEKTKESAPEKHIPPKKDVKEVHPSAAHQGQSGFAGTLRKFFRGRTK